MTFFLNQEELLNREANGYINLINFNIKYIYIDNIAGMDTLMNTSVLRIWLNSSLGIKEIFE